MCTFLNRKIHNSLFKDKATKTRTCLLPPSEVHLKSVTYGENIRTNQELEEKITPKRTKNNIKNASKNLDPNYR